MIDVYTPETMPMARLAEYMAQLAIILGEPASVHFDRLEPGSTVLVHRIEREAVPKVRERAASVRRGDAPPDAWRGYRTVNKLLREDNGVGLLKDKNAAIIRFPGREEAGETFASIRQYGSVDGRVMRIGGTDLTVPVLLQSEDQLISGCWTTKDIARQLAQRLFEQARVYGRGRWNRDADGKWNLLDFKIESFDPLDEAPLSEAIEELRSTQTQWDEFAYSELELIRHGRTPEKRNGGH